MAADGGTGIRFSESFSVRFGTPADIPIPIAFTLDKPGVVTLVIDNARGNRVRNLISETPFEAGKHVVEWDGCDDHESKQVAEQPVFTFSGNPVGPGRNTVRGIVRHPVKLRYEMPLYTAGNPPWDTPDGRGGWLQDYNPPTAVVGLSDKMLVGSPVGEAFGVVWTDLEGQGSAGSGAFRAAAAGPAPNCSPATTANAPTCPSPPTWPTIGGRHLKSRR